MNKYYWLKIKKDFYKRHDIKILESMPNGVEYVWFYLKLMMESIDHEGMLRFNEFIPYDDNMLATITGTNVDIVRSAMKLFVQLGMIDITDDRTIYIETVAKMIGSESQSAERVRKHRELKSDVVPMIENLYEEKEVKHKHGEYKHVMLTDTELERLKKDYPNVDMDSLIVWFDKYIEEKGYKSKSHNLAIRRWVITAFSKPVGKQRVEQVIDYQQPEVSLSEEEQMAIINALKEMR